MTIRELTREQAIEIAKTIFPWPDMMTNIQSVFYPYVEEHYEDAREFVKILFDGPAMGDWTYHHMIEIHPNLDCICYMKRMGKNDDQKEYLWELLSTRSQRAVQMKFMEWGIVPSDKNQRRKLVTNID